MFFKTLDDFIPKHIAMMVDMVSSGRLTLGNEEIIRTPGFYLLGGLIVLITGFPPESLIFLPIQLVPYLFVIFCLLYIISDNAIIASIITLLEFTSGITGTRTLFFWPHGIGTILFLVILILLLGFVKDKTKKEYIFLIMVTGASLVFLSYSLTAMSLILLTIVAVLIAFVSLILSRFDWDYEYNVNTSKAILVALIVISAVELGLTRFMYDVFIPTIQTTQNIDVSAWEKFSISYLNPELNSVILSPIMIHYPISITVISAIKYGLLALVIFGFCLFEGQKFLHNKRIEGVDIILISVVLMQLIYSIPRQMIGEVMVTALWLPGILCLARFSRISNRFRLFSKAVIITLLILVFSYYGYFAFGGLIDRIDYEGDGYEESNQWINENSNSAAIVSDELTNNFRILFNMKAEINDHSLDAHYNEVVKGSLLMSIPETAALVKLQEGDIDKNRYYVLNNKLSRMSLQNWIVIRSWQLSNNIVSANNIVNKVYENSLISVYHP